MKRENLFTVNVDDDGIIDFDEFVMRRESEELAGKREALDGQLGRVLHKSIRRGLLPYFIAWISAIVGVLGIWRTVTESIEAGELSVIPLTVGIVFLCLALVFFIRYRKVEKSGDLDRDTDLLNAEYDSLNALSKKELGVPENAVTVEIFTDMYSSEDEAPSTVYTNEEVSVFLEDGRLCFHYGCAVLGVPTSEIEAIVRVDAPVTFESWEKDVPYDGGDYLQYKIEKNEVDKYEENYSMRGYCSVRFTHMDTPFEIVVPLYDIAPIAELIGMELTEE